MSSLGEGYPDRDPNYDPTADYEADLACIRSTLVANAGMAADLGEGVRVFAGWLDPDDRYGAREGDTKLVLVVTETAETDAGGKTYGLVLHHYGSKGRLLSGSDWVDYRTAFGSEDLEGYDEDGAKEWRDAVEDAEYDSDEPWFWVPDDHPCKIIRDAKAQQARVRRVLSAWRLAQAAEQEPGSTEAA